jgi:hypothetical protein
MKFMIKKHLVLLGSAGMVFFLSGAEAAENIRSRFGGTWLDRFDALPPCMQNGIEHLNQQCRTLDREVAQEFVEGVLGAFQQLIPRHVHYELLWILWEMVVETICRFDAIWRNPVTQALVNEINAVFLKRNVGEFVAIEPGDSPFERMFPMHVIDFERAIGANNRDMLRDAFWDFLAARPLCDFPNVRFGLLGISANLTTLVRKARKNGLMDEELEGFWAKVREVYPIGEIVVKK